MKYMILIILTTSITCNTKQPNLAQAEEINTDRLIQVTSIIDDSVIHSNDVQAIIDPLWWTADIYQSYDVYVTSTKQFSENQRYVFAIQWYQAEVNNGGHDQFFSNSTGIVWKDVINGFKQIGLTNYLAIIDEAVSKFKDKPDFDRDIRNIQLQSSDISFDDLDSRFYELDKTEPLQTELMRFIRNNRSDFYFHGQISRPAYLP